MPSVSKRAILVLVALAIPIAVTGLQSTTASWTSATLVTSTEVSGADKPNRLMRFGLRNNFKEAQLLCVSTTSYRVDHTKHTNGRTSGGVHSCRTEESFKLVLSGETTFELVPTDPIDLIHDDAIVEVSVTIAYRGVSDAIGATSRTTVTWRGTVRDAVAAARRLEF